MHFILALLGLIGGLGMLIWRISMAIQAAREIKDAAEGLTDLPRKMRFRNKANRPALESLNDAKEMASVLLYGFISLDYNQAEKSSTLATHLVALFDIPSPQAQELIALARWHTQATNDPKTLARKLSPKLLDSVGESALQDVIDLMTDLAPQPMTYDQQAYLDIIKRNLRP